MHFVFSVPLTQLDVSLVTSLLREAKRKTSTQLSETELGPWDSQLADFGARIRIARYEALDILRGPFAAFYDRFSPTGETSDIRYKGVISECIAEDFEQALQRYGPATPRWLLLVCC